MAKGYRPVDRDQQFLIAPDMHQWLPANHPVWMLIDLVTELDTTAFHAARRTGGVGRAGYHPDMLLTLLIWAWSQGLRSSRKIERACDEVVPFRIICAGDTPDHVTLARFRKDNHTACADLFAKVLVLAGKTGLGDLGTIALDGVKIASNASLGANRTAGGLDALQAAEEAKLAASEAEAAESAAAAIAARTLDEADGADAADDDEYGDGPGPGALPAELVNPSARLSKIKEAKAQLDDAENSAAAAREKPAAAYLARLDAGDKVEGRVPAGAQLAAAQARLTEAVTAQEDKLRRHRERIAAAEKAGRRPASRFAPKPVEEHHLVIRRRAQLAAVAVLDSKRLAARATEDATRRRNTTDPTSRMQPLRGGGWVQGFNCQFFTAADGLILATGVGTSSADVEYFAEMVAAACAGAVEITRARGIEVQVPEGTPVQVAAAQLIGMMLFDAGYLSATNLESEGPDRLIATGKGGDLHRARKDEPVTGPPPPQANSTEKMHHRLRTEEGAARYKMRSHIAETPFGHAKHNLNFRRFTTIGLDRATSEWAFHGAVVNIGKILDRWATDRAKGAVITA